jgi:antitoxin component of MazEF toxin-antitoxin module
MATQIARIGSAVTVEIPEELLRRANLAVGDPVEWTLSPAGSLSLRTPNSGEDLGTEEGYEEWKLAEIEAGNWASGEKVREWVRSLGTPNELPPPL